MIFSSAICFLQVYELIGVNYAPTKGKLLRIYQKRGFRNIDFLGEKGLLRLAAQKEGAQAQICLLRRTNYASLPHKTNYTRGEELLQQIFL
jgi:hypothetical protein